MSHDLATARFTLASKADASALASLGIFRPRTVGPITLVAPSLTEAQRRSEETAINEDFHACGCPEASIGLVAGVAGYTIAALALGSFHWGWLLAIAVGATAIGKLGGKLIANLRLRRRLARLQPVLVPDQHEDDYCG